MRRGVASLPRRTEERSLHTLDDGGHIDEVNGRVGVRRRWGGARAVLALAEVGMRPSFATGTRAADLARGSVVGHAENLEEIVHG